LASCPQIGKLSQAASYFRMHFSVNKSLCLNNSVIRFLEPVLHNIFNLFSIPFSLINRVLQNDFGSLQPFNLSFKPLKWYESYVRLSTRRRKKELKENKQKDSRALFILQQAIADTIIARIMGATSAKEAWSTR
ncbi:hypothetical protein CR513_38652, partial [Mucuna pruriens]